MTWLYVAENGDEVLNARGDGAIGVRRVLLRAEKLGRAVTGSLNRRVKRLSAIVCVWRCVARVLCPTFWLLAHVQLFNRRLRESQASVPWHGAFSFFLKKKIK
jgi:hypothetical protein